MQGNMIKDYNLPRPDKLLQKRLIGLAYSLAALTVSLILLFWYPQHLVLCLGVAVALTIYCLILSLRTLKAGEAAINFGGFAGELVRLSSKAKRIDDARGNPVLENDAAKELAGKQDILDFLQANLSDNRNSHIALQRLKNAYLNLVSEKVSLSLSLPGENSETWLEIILKPIFLKKTDIFEGPFSIKKVKKDSYYYWSFRDITAEHHMEQILQGERQFLQDFTDYLPGGLLIYNKDYAIEYCNHAFAQSLLLDRDQIMGRSLTDFLSPNSPLPPNNMAWNNIIHLLDKNGADCETYLRQNSFRDGNEIKIRAAAVTNLPNDKALHRQLSLAIDEISWLFDFAPIGIVFADTKGIILDGNRQAAQFMQIKKEDMIKRNFLDWIKSNEQHALQREFDNIAGGGKKNASLELTLQPEGRTALTYITPMNRLHSGKESPIEGFVIYLIDATEHKKLEIQFAQAQKMQAMGQLAGGVAHDFNNLLTAIIGFCDLLLQRHGIGDPSFADLIQVKNNANRAAGLVRQLLAFSRKQPLQPKLIDVTENFLELSQMLKRVIGENIILKFYHGSDLGFIKVDPVQFSQVIINLAVNAKDAMNGKGLLTISTHTENIAQPQTFGEDIIKPGEFVVIEVSDTGCGISPENLNRIFEPFFSTKQNIVGSGTGLGLAMVYGIVRQTGGFIKVESKLGEGTTFSIHLPRFKQNCETGAKEENIAAESITAADGSPVITIKEQNKVAGLPINQKFIFGLNVSAIDRTTERQTSHPGIKILFVEDEDSVRSFAVRALKKKGYEVIGCNSAENALEQLQNCRDFNLLVTDMVMPGMNGVELAHLVKEKIKDIKIILASGYSEEIARNELAASDEFEFMAKPFSLGDLTKKIFDVLNKE